MNCFNFLLTAPINQTIIVPLLLFLVIMSLKEFYTQLKLRANLSFSCQLPVQDEFHLIGIEPRLLLWYLVMYLPEEAGAEKGKNTQT